MKRSAKYRQSFHSNFPEEEAYERLIPAKVIKVRITLTMTQDKLFQTVFPLLDSNYRNINVNLW